MKILHIGMKYDYGNQDKGFSYEYYNFHDTLVRMNGGEHDVVHFPFDEVMKDVGRDEMNKKLLETVRREKPDLCFFAIFNDEIKKKTIKEITEKGNTVTYNWFSDDQWRFVNYSKHWAPLFHWVSTTHSKAPEKYKKMGYKNVIKTQFGCNQFIYKKTGAGLKHDVTFVGQPHGSRKKIVQDIADAGIKIECWGGGWPNGRISQDDMIKLFSESRINLNPTDLSSAFGTKPLAKIFLRRWVDGSYHPYNPKFWIPNIASLVNKLGSQVKGRNFEVPGSGGFLLTGDADNLTEYFEDGKEIVIYKDTKDLMEKAKYYLSHEEERAAIAEAGYERTLREHTYEKRFNEIFKTMGLV